MSELMYMQCTAPTGSVKRRAILRELLMACGTWSCKALASAAEQAVQPGPSAGPQTPYWPTQEWRTGAAESEGLNAARLLSMVQSIPQRFPNVYSFLVVRHGVLVDETYFRGRSATSAFRVHSVTKSFTSALVGIALQRRALTGLDQRISELLPEYFQRLDSRKRQITLRHLLTMTAGFGWKDRQDYPLCKQSTDWIRYAVARPLVSNPGETFNYNSMESHLLSAAISRATGKPAADFARERLFDPIGIRPAAWPSDPQGNTEGGNGLVLTARDMSRFGYLYLNRGSWEGREIVPSSWIDDSTRKHVDVPPPEFASYGFQWWVNASRGEFAFWASGFGEQYIYIFPRLALVMVSTAEDKPSAMRSTRVLPSELLPVVRDYHE